jgi:tetratricopeptide (TPR) repeat protein
MAITASVRFTGRRFSVAGLLFLVTAIPVFGQGLEDIDPFGDEPAVAQPDDDQLGIPGFADEAPVPGLDEEPEQETRESILEKARGYAENEEWKEAIAELSRVLSRNSRDGEYAFERGKAFLALGDKQAAIADFDIAATYGGPFPGVQEEALKNLGELRLELGQVQEAVDDLDQAIRLNPTSSELLYLRGKALVRLVRVLGAQGAQQLDDAKTTLDRAIEADPTNAQAYIERSNVYALQNRFDKAIADVDLAVENEGDSADVMGRAALAYLTRAGTERARYDADLNQVVDDFKKGIDQLSAFLDIEGEKTKDDYEDAAPETITSGQAYLYRAIAQMGLANNSHDADKFSLYSSVIADCDKALEYEPDNPDAVYQKGVAQRLSGDLDGAVDTFTDGLNLSPDFTEARLRRGIVYYYLGDMTLARGDFERCLESQADGRAAFWIGVTYAREGNYNDAIRYYSQAIRENPMYKPAHSNRALAYLKTDRPARAVEDYNELIRRDPDDTLARERRDMARAQLDY